MNDKKYYIDLIEKICFKYNLSGSLIEKTYIEGINNNDLCCNKASSLARSERRWIIFLQAKEKESL